MIKGYTKYLGPLLGISLLLGTGYSAQAEGPCFWEGKAPLCNGDCNPGYTLTRRDDKGDGDKCVTGTKAYCCKTSEIRIEGTAPLCNGKCKVGEETLGPSDYGPNGKNCVTGKAAICRIKMP
jgi:hypothetical protein